MVYQVANNFAQEKKKEKRRQKYKTKIIGSTRQDKNNRDHTSR